MSAFSSLRTSSDWNSYFRQMIEAILDVYAPREPVDADRLARTICSTIDGGLIMARALRRPEVLPEQLPMVRQHVKLLSSGAVLRVALEEAA